LKLLPLLLLELLLLVPVDFCALLASCLLLLLCVLPLLCVPLVFVFAWAADPGSASATTPAATTLVAPTAAVAERTRA